MVSDDRFSEASVKSSVTMEIAVSLAVPASAAPPSLMSAASATETGLQSQAAATRRLLGQGMMNISSSASVAGVVQQPSATGGRLMSVSPSSSSSSVPALQPNSSAASGFASSGRQIKGQTKFCIVIEL